jgi:hypothetical protein
MEIKFNTTDGSQYLYKIVYSAGSPIYRSWLETIGGDRNAEFTLDSNTPYESIQCLKSILSDKGFVIEHFESIENSFEPRKHFQETLRQLEG